MSDRRLIITVPSDKYKTLSALARDAVRSPEQQAAYFVRRALEETTDRQPAESPR